MQYSTTVSILLASSGVFAASYPKNTGYVELAAGAGLIGYAFESKYFGDCNGFGHVFNERIGGVLSNIISFKERDIVHAYHTDSG